MILNSRVRPIGCEITYWKLGYIEIRKKSVVDKHLLRDQLRKDVEYLRRNPCAK